MESFGHRAYREGEWKLVFAPEVSGGTGEYALYDLATDPGETKDVAAEHPDVVERLAAKWHRYAEANGVVAVDFDVVNADAPRSSALLHVVDWGE
ncbi:arylsulfatase [Actinomadura madurae]|uniref:Arylsulfatase n=1 Tax=Actinomadura madurae TaxID=1993 RepID=A0A1I5LCX0_9ACTN|nr:hypothetical protein [Actinomadura madurae]SFO95042.1 arylsulfatase [Actinomadura madurae]